MKIYDVLKETSEQKHGVVMEDKKNGKDIPWEVFSQARIQVLGGDSDDLYKNATGEQLVLMQMNIDDEMNRRLHESQT
jgi:hypothetical protein